ncbi:MAG: TVP38/TMEM64 family protein [Chitinophagaceae bacterium]|nr:MAG: TVP38/TMEM64 family protein [Chitinophagaceae bacterium]
MKEFLLDLFSQHPGAALGLSLLASVLLAVLGVLPSVFITAANILFFGFWKGTAISFAGEALGAAVSFWLYRKGFRKGAAPAFARYPKARRLLEAQGTEAFGLILSLRLLPFVPSGLVTFAAAIGRVSAGTFVLASSIGKAPALLLEAWSVQKVTEGSVAGKIILAVVAFGLLFLLLRKKSRQ